MQGGLRWRQALKQARGDPDVESYLEELNSKELDAAPLAELEKELRMRQARGDLDVESFLEELDAAADRLKETSRQLDAYVRANVPIAGGN
jgi:hypothetical protein